jgi:hypothetical protein
LVLSVLLVRKATLVLPGLPARLAPLARLARLAPLARLARLAPLARQARQVRTR